MKLKKAMVFGSFDVLHDGHRYLFRRAKEKAEKLIVVVARDYNYKKIRGYEPVHDEKERLKSVSEEQEVDKAILGEKYDVYSVIRKERPDIICLGYDQEHFIKGLREKLNNMGLKKTIITRIEAYKPDELKSSIIKARMKITKK